MATLYQLAHSKRLNINLYVPKLKNAIKTENQQ